EVPRGVPGPEGADEGDDDGDALEVVHGAPRAGAGGGCPTKSDRLSRMRAREASRPRSPRPETDAASRSSSGWARHAFLAGRRKASEGRAATVGVKFDAPPRWSWKSPNDRPPSPTAFGSKRLSW